MTTASSREIHAPRARGEGKPPSSASEVRARCEKTQRRHDPPKRRAPGIRSRENAGTVGERSPQKRLGGGVVCASRTGVTVRWDTCSGTRTEGLPHQLYDALDVVGLRKQIHQMHVIDAVTAARQMNQVSGERCRVARHVGHVGGAQLREIARDTLS